MLPDCNGNDAVQLEAAETADFQWFCGGTKLASVYVRKENGDSAVIFCSRRKQKSCMKHGD